MAVILEEKNSFGNQVSMKLFSVIRGICHFHCGLYIPPAQRLSVLTGNKERTHQSGVSTCRNLRNRNTRLPVVLMSGQGRNRPTPSANNNRSFAPATTTPSKVKSSSSSQQPLPRL